MTQKRALGRGLGALLGEPNGSAVAPPEPAGEVVREVPVERVRPNPHQPRKTFEPRALDELKASIAEHGVLVPILVRERGDSYELIAGERRWRACAALQLATIPAIVRSGTELQSLEMAIIENLQRENLNPLEEAAGMAQLIEMHGYTQDRVAQRLGRARPSVTNALRLLSLPESIKELIAAGTVSAGHAKALLAAPESARMELANRVAREGLSVRALERVITMLAAPPPAKTTAADRALTPDEREFETRLRTRLGTAVALRRGPSGGTIEVKFAGESDLLRIADILLGD